MAVVVVAAAGIYFGTGSSKPAIAPAPPPPAQESVAKVPDNEPLPSFEETKDPPIPAESPSAAVAPFADMEPPPFAEKPKPAPVESARKAAPAREVSSPPVKSQSQRAAQDPARSARPAPSTASRGGASPGVYETLRGTTVHEDPSPSSKVVASIPAGVRVNVVNSSGDWLEVHSRRGNPPGFIRRGDAVFVESAN